MASLENVTGSLFLDEWGKIIMKKNTYAGMREREREKQIDTETLVGGNEREREKCAGCLSLTEELLYSSTLSSGRQRILQEATYHNIRGIIYIIIICSVVFNKKIYIFSSFRTRTRHTTENKRHS